MFRCQCMNELSSYGMRVLFAVSGLARRSRGEPPAADQLRAQVGGTGACGRTCAMDPFCCIRGAPVAGSAGRDARHGLARARRGVAVRPGG